MNEQVIDKIRKLLNMTEANGCSLAESSSAAALAQRLMTEHRISVLDLDKGAVQEEIHNRSFLFRGERSVHWKADLAQGICYVNGCRMYFNNKTERRQNGRFGNVVYYQVIGRDTDIQIVSYFYNYLEREIERLCKDAQKRTGGKGKTWSTSFKHGCEREISRRLKESFKQVKTNSVQTTAIVKLDARDADVERWEKEKLNLKYDLVIKDNIHDHSAYVEGVEAGKKVSLNKGIENDGSEQKLLE